jgi:integrase/recombinase XerD
MQTDAPQTVTHGGGNNDASSSLPAVFLPVPADAVPQPVSTIAALAEIPEEDIWLAKQKSKRTRRAYKQNVGHFMRTLSIRSYDELRQVDHRAVIAWERFIREVDRAAASTIRRRLAALSSLMKHLTRHGHLSKNHVAEVERPAINREEGTTLAFSKAVAAKLLKMPTRRPWRD